MKAIGKAMDQHHFYTFFLAVPPLADLHGGGEAEARDRHVHGDPRGHLGIL